MSLVANAGSADDPPEKLGLLHYFEHTAFQGTGRRTRDELRTLQTKFLYSNAQTGKTKTEYSCEAVAKKLPLICDFLCDIFFNTLLTENTVAHETEVILNEIAAAEDNDSHVAYRAFRESLWQKNPLRQRGAGTTKTIRHITLEDILAAQSLWYVPANTIAIAAGNVIHKEFVGLINQHVTLSAKTKPPTLSWDTEYDTPPSQKVITIPRPHREKATLLFGCKFPLITKERELILSNFLINLLLQGWQSRLWNELREKRSLIYTAGGSIASEYPLGAYFAARIEALPKRIPLLCEIVPQLLAKPLFDHEVFENTKEVFDDHLSLGYDGLYLAIYNVLRLMAYGEPPEHAEMYFQRKRNLLKTISMEEVEAFRKATLIPDKFITVLLDPST